MTLYRHPFQIALGVSLAIIGGRSLLNMHTQPESISNLPAWLAYGYAGSLVVGGLGMVVGLIIARRTTWGLAIEQVGLWITTAGLVAYAIGLTATVTNARASMTILILLALAGACIVRSRAAILDARYSLQGIRQEAHRRNGGGH